MLKQFIEQLSTDMGFEQALEANDDGSYSLLLEPDIDITLRENPNQGIVFYTRVVDIPSKKTEAFLLKAMRANLLGRETGGGTLGLDEEGKKVVLIDFLSEDLTYREFHDKLEDFVNYTEAWRSETAEFIEKQEE